MMIVLDGGNRQLPAQNIACIISASWKGGGLSLLSFDSGGGQQRVLLSCLWGEERT